MYVPQIPLLSFNHYSTIAPEGFSYVHIILLTYPYSLKYCPIPAGVVCTGMESEELLGRLLAQNVDDDDGDADRENPKDKGQKTPDALLDPLPT